MSRAVVALLLMLLLSGCSHRTPAYKAPPAPPTFSLVVPRQCIESVSLSPDTYCKGKTLKELNCFRVRIKVIKGCEQVDVQHD